jgi:hypothetical protein
MTWLWKRWRAFWFAPARSDDLGISRILFYGLILLLYLHHDFSEWSSLAQVHWRPMWSFRVLGLTALAEGTIQILQVGWKVSLFLSCIGLATRFSTVAAFVLGFYLLGLQQNFSRIIHNDAVVVLVMGTLALSRCGDRWSIDSLLKREGADSCLSGEYTWPSRMIWLIMSLIYFASGFAKLRHSGLAWIFSDNMATLLVTHNYVGSPWTSWGLHVAQFTWLCYLMAAAAIIVEIAFPIAMFSRRLRWPILSAAFLMHLGILALMGPSFWQFEICYVFWVPWSALGSWGRARLAKPEAKRQTGMLNHAQI